MTDAAPQLPAVPGFSYAHLARCMMAAYANQEPRKPSEEILELRAEADLDDAPWTPETVERLFTGPLGFDDAIWLEHDADTRGVAATLGDAFLWVDQGTQNLAGWASNLKRRRRKWSELGRDDVPGKVHCGFGRSALDQHDEILSRAAGAGSFGLIGHSRGGAHATCHAGLALAADHEVDFLFTCGKPRVGNGTFSRWLSGHAGLGLGVRGVRNNDIVVRLPTVGYRHENGPGSATDGFVLLWIEHDGDISTDPTRWARTRDRFLGRIDALGGGEPTIAEVAELRMADYHVLEERGLVLLTKVLETGSRRLAELIGDAAATAVLEWAESRAATLDLKAGVLDGTHDHAIALYYRDLAAAGV